MREPQANDPTTGTEIFAEDEPAAYLYQLVGGEVAFGEEPPASSLVIRDLILKTLGGIA